MNEYDKNKYDAKWLRFQMILITWNGNELEQRMNKIKFWQYFNFFNAIRQYFSYFQYILNV